jgi:hypothetical protein
VVPWPQNFRDLSHKLIGDSGFYPADGSSPCLTRKTTKALRHFPLSAHGFSHLQGMSSVVLLSPLSNASQNNQERKGNNPLNLVGGQYVVACAKSVQHQFPSLLSTCSRTLDITHSALVSTITFSTYLRG